MFNSFLARYVRHALTTLIGYGVAKGWFDEIAGNQLVDAILAVSTPLGSFFLVTYLSKLSDSKLLEKLKQYTGLSL